MKLSTRVAKLEQSHLPKGAPPPYIHHRIVMPTASGDRELVPSHQIVCLFDGRTFTSKQGESIEQLVARAKDADEHAGECYRVIDVVDGLRLSGGEGDVSTPARITHDMDAQEAMRKYCEFVRGE